MVILIIFFLFIGGGWLIGKTIGNILFPKSNDEVFYSSSSGTHKTIINNFTTENHLHISNKDLKSILKE
ncbi:hypothetical protein [Ichthyenterobacterium magnum]|uniref:Uncharacterized protein n=1 Tax=Ichthyenterobacterium magnum TaxID=1230530 RepID=A0A420DFQ1_9FLAO|nr:hypothetical protein [Ichthyenterobacterium magnum]RKE91904.1 hypothetical protein BXY80_2333 [Ichthyenterobacterium magnum]